ncbi:hypothetical protein F5Y06DRAFT_172566 [Hypoxylon sp. FL0890]|nr:hypothetical protein F5Y06DRAFT_172566 [Hypoxylon sp. FL0890]
MDSAEYSQPSNHLYPTSTYVRPPSTRHSSYQRGAASSSTFANGNGNGRNHDDHQQQRGQQRMAADQAYKVTFASHERAIFSDEARARARRRDAARNKALFRGPFWRRPEFYAVTLGFLGLLYPILNQYVIMPWVDSINRARGNDGMGS